MYSTTRLRRSERQLNGSGRALFIGASLLLIACVLLLGTAVGQEGHDERLRRNLCLLLIGVFGLVVAFRKSSTLDSERLDRIITVCAILLPCYALLQVLPLPVSLVSFLSPARAELLKGLAPLTGGLPGLTTLSIVPGITFTHFVLLTGYAVVFFSIRALVRSAPGSSWFFAVPVLLAATLETIAAFFQVAAGVPARGTYTVKNHFAGLLVMALPFAVAWLLAVANGASRGGARDAQFGIRFSAALALSAFLLLGISFSLSRGAFIAALASGAVLAVLAFPSGMSVRGRLFTCGAAGLVLFIGLFYLTPMVLIQRLAEHSSSGRTAIWRNTLDLISAYPVVGCGLGGYESAMLRFKTTVLLSALDYAHNDYLQFLGELGVLGFLVGATFLSALLVRTVRAASQGLGARWVGVGCAGALTAILAHSFFDFNLYVPANAIILAWIAGVSAALPVTGQREEDKLPIEVLSAAESRSMRSR